MGEDGSAMCRPYPPKYGVLLSDFEKLMQSAFKMAEKGLGYTSPNPPVGAIIYKNGQIIARGYHKRAGLPHAEIEALRKAGKNARGAILVTTLEPCSHHGKTPPCADAIISAGVKTVVGAINDRNPIVNGRGYRRLREAGIEVVSGVIENKAAEFYGPYFKFITTGLPFVTLKFAQSIDGRIATRTGDSRWISSPESLKLSHQLRAVNDSILIGNKTVIADNPKLTTRLVKGPNPIRIVLSASGNVNLRRYVFTNKSAQTFIATSPKSRVARHYNKIIELNKKGLGLDLRQLLKRLGKMGIISLLVEGGSGVLTSFLKNKLADKVIICIAPTMIGRGIDSIGELDIVKIGKSIRFSDVAWRKSGPDTIFIGRPVWR